ncbi:hypothetical protein PANA5342_1830 [Pantoea ananatis LMG 5342]|nr:hypothetical protein PANA5342_1830 [Pantoea ananatis LMG 5342]
MACGFIAFNIVIVRSEQNFTRDACFFSSAGTRGSSVLSENITKGRKAIAPFRICP